MHITQQQLTHQAENERPPFFPDDLRCILLGEHTGMNFEPIPTEGCSQGFN